MDYSIINFKTIYTKDEAIAWLIGLGDVYIKPEEGATPEEIDALPAFDLEEYLQGEYDNLVTEYKWAKLQNSSDEILAEKLAKANQWKELIAKARRCMGYFEDEIAKGEASTITIYPLDKTFGLYYTQISIKQWWDRVKLENQDLSNSDLKSSAEDQSDESQEENDKDGKLGSREKNIYTLMAYLIDAFVFDAQNKAVKSRYRSRDGELKVSVTAEDIKSLIDDNGGKELHGLSVESIKTHIENAIDFRKDKLKGK